MQCLKCGFYTEQDMILCPECGELLSENSSAKQQGVQAIRQGKRARQAVLNPPMKREEERKRRRRGASHAPFESMKPADLPEIAPEMPEHPVPEAVTAVADDRDAGEETEDGHYERRYRPVYDEGGIRAEQALAFAARYDTRKFGRRRHVNWMKTGFILAIVLILAASGIWLFLNETDMGQLIMARLGQKANATALWAVGEEQMDRGEINEAIASFEKAQGQDETEGHVNPDGLLLLASAYEAAGRVDDAAALYQKIYEDTPSRTEAYVNHIRILLASNIPGDQAKAGELMKLAYEKTEDESFRTQRSDLLPAPPGVDLTGAFYDKKEHITLSSFQGFDIYYTFDDEAKLPVDGTLYTDRIFLDEGIHHLRAVAVNGELVSDELSTTYKIIMPSPQTPRATLAPNAYKSRQWVKLKPGLDNENDSDIVIFYTVDGSPPDADSPIASDEKIWLPTGDFVELKAVAVNRYNKVSNTLEVKYKISAKPYPLKAWTDQEPFADLLLNQTTLMEFQQRFGEGNLAGEVNLAGFDSECRKYEYDWGYAVMNRLKTAWVLMELYLTDSTAFTPPRGTNVGDTEAFVTGKFRDMGQVASPSGNRGLYANDDGTGKIWLQEDGTKIIRYRCNTTESHFWQLDYLTNTAGTVHAIDWLYEP